MNNPTKTDAKDVRWNLSILYSDIHDPQIDKDIATLVSKSADFNICFKGKLKEALGQAIADYIEIDMLQNKVMAYLFLKTSLNTGDADAKTKMAEAQTTLSKAFGEYLTFFDLELVALDEATLEKLYAKNELLAKHRPWVNHARVFKPHFLSEQVESALTKRSSFGSGAWGEFFEELEADLEFHYKDEKKTLDEILNVLTESKDAEERRELLKIINAGFGGAFSKYSAQTLYMVTGADAVERSERGYRHPMDATNKSNRIPDAVVEALHKAVYDAGGPLARRYYRLKAAHLGLKKLRWSDRNAPMPFADTVSVPFTEALETVLAAYQSFSPTLAGLIHASLEAKRIDAPADKGKRGGAFNYSTVLPNKKTVSFTLLNYLGSNRDVMTLAHELGHGAHGLLAGEAQGALMCRAPIAYAETASVFGEMTAFNFLKKNLAASGDEKSLLALIMGKIDDIINTVVRQISFSDFERRLHGMDPTFTTWNEPKKLSVPAIDEIWLEVTKRYYGEDGDVFTYENAEHLWAYVGHFHRPFYVYGYAFGELMTQSLYAKQAQLGDRFEPLYLDLLRSGSTKNVMELTVPFGLNPAAETFWVDGINVGLGAMVGEAEELSRKMSLSFRA